MTKTYLTIAQTSRKLANRSRSSIYRDIANGRLPKPFKLGNRTLLIEEEIDQMIADSPRAEITTQK